MTLNTATIMVLAALAASVIALFQHKERVLPTLAVVTSGVETLMALKILTLSIKSISLILVLGGILAVAGAIIWARSGPKVVVTCATVITLIGALQFLSGLNVLK